MQKFVGTILVVVVCLAVFSSPVTAGDVLGPGDIAIIGFNFDDGDEFTFVCLTDIADGTEIRFTDNGWTSSDTFYYGESILSWYTPGGCELGQIVNINLNDTIHKNNTTNGPFDLSSSGDQILVYQQYLTNPPSFIFALNSEGSNWQLNTTNFTSSARPKGLDETNSIALDEIDNAIYVGPKSFNTTGDALAAIVNKANWSGSDTIRQTMPSGSFSFTTTAVELSEFSAETGVETAPWWVLVGLVVIPILVMVFKRPKRDCCK